MSNDQKTKYKAEYKIVQYGSVCEVRDELMKNVAIFVHPDPDVRLNDAKTFLGAIHREFDEITVVVTSGT